MAKKYRAFATGSQASDWSFRNCETCKKGYLNKDMKYQCEFEHALDVAYCGDGQISEETAKAIGFLDSEGCDLWECPGWERGRK